MKKLLLFIILIPIFSIAQENITLFFDSNIEYSPFGIKVMIKSEDKTNGGYFTIKLAEDWLFRNVDMGSKPKIYNENADRIDISELMMAAGIVSNINNNIDFYLGVGVMGGDIFMKQDNQNEWSRTTRKVAMPLASFGLILTRNRIKFSIGNETAFTSDKNYPKDLLNDKSFARLSSFTLGIGYSF